MLKIHHLGHSQSERILWLCEELELPFVIVKYTRDATTRLSPPALKALTPLGAAPVLETDGLLLPESAAIVEFILAKYGNGRLQYGPDHPEFAQYLYWFHFANGNLQPVMFRAMANTPAAQERLEKVLSLLDARLWKAKYLAGSDFTAADIMSVFSLTTMRIFRPTDLAPYPNIRAYLGRIGERPAYRRAMAKGDPDRAPLLA